MWDVSGWTDWAVVISAALAGLQTVVFTITLVVVSRQLGESNRERAVNGTIFIFDRLQTADASASRARLYNVVAPRIMLNKPRDLALLTRLVNEFDTIGFMVERKMVDRAMVMELHYDAILRVWHVMEPWIDSQRSYRGVYGQYFRKLVWRTRRHVVVHHAGEEIKLSGKVIFPSP